MTNAMNSRAEALGTTMPDVSELVDGDTVGDDGGAKIASGAQLADVLHPSMLVPGGSLAETQPSHVQVSIDFAESDIGVPGRAEFVAVPDGSRLADTDGGEIGMVTRAEVEDALLTTGLSDGQDRHLGDSLEGKGISGGDEASEVDPAGLGLEEYEEAALARTEAHLVNRVRDRATVGKTSSPAAFAGSSSDGLEAAPQASVISPASEPFNSADVFRELAESGPVRETLQGLENPAAAPAVSPDPDTVEQDRAISAPFQSLSDADIPPAAREVQASLPADTRIEDEDHGILMLDEEDDAGLDGSAVIDPPEAPEKELAPEPQVSFAEPIDWSSLDTGPDEEAYDLDVTAADTEVAMNGDTNDDPFATAPPAVTPEQDFAELGFHHNFVIGDFSADRGVETDAIELDLSGLDFDDDGVTA